MFSSSKIEYARSWSFCFSTLAAGPVFFTGVGGVPFKDSRYSMLCALSKWKLDKNPAMSVQLATKYSSLLEASLGSK